MVDSDLHAGPGDLHEGELFRFGGGLLDRGRDKLGDGGARLDGCGCSLGMQTDERPQRFDKFSICSLRERRASNCATMP